MIEEARGGGRWLGHFQMPIGVSFVIGDGPFVLTTAGGRSGQILITHVTRHSRVIFEGITPLQRPE